MPIKATIKESSYGIIPIHAINKTFLLVREKAGHWGIPKGHPNPGESELQTAQREFTEETGIHKMQIMDEAIFVEQYSFEQDGVITEKTVKYFLAKVPEVQIAIDTKEILEAKWFRYEDAIKAVQHKGRQQVISEAKECINKYF